MTASEVFQFTSAARQTAKEVGKVFTKKKMEEAAGVLFISIGLFLTGWFYYSLYQALHDYAAF